MVSGKIWKAFMRTRDASGFDPRRSRVVDRVLDERLGQMRADERKTRQVVLNLLSNAIKFTPNG